MVVLAPKILFWLAPTDDLFRCWRSKVKVTPWFRYVVAKTCTSSILQLKMLVLMCQEDWSKVLCPTRHKHGSFQRCSSQPSPGNGSSLWMCQGEGRCVCVLCLYVNYGAGFTSATPDVSVTFAVTIALSSMVFRQSSRSSKLRSGKSPVLLLIISCTQSNVRLILWHVCYIVSMTFKRKFVKTFMQCQVTDPSVMCYLSVLLSFTLTTEYSSTW